ncbi:MAG: SxtJ family membrane protein [Bacteroidota bacterium]
MEGRDKVYESVLAVLLLLLLLYYFFWRTEWMLVGTVVFLVVTLVSPWVARVVSLGWNTLTKGIGFAMNHVLMTIIFLVFLTPIAFLYRLTRRKPTTNGNESAFKDRNHRYVPKDIESPW